MIAVKKDNTKIPESLKNEKFQKHFEKYKRNEIKASRNYYATKEVKNKLKKIYNNKCAYCESTEYEPDIEYYRPVSKYKFLAYEWTNLLPSCPVCNNKKGFKFPVKNTIELNGSITDLQKLNKLEEPLIINPEIDDPKNFFFFNEKTGEIIAVNNNERAEKTIEICKLNRTNLLENRKGLYDNIKSQINLINLTALQKNVDLSKAVEKIIEHFYKEQKNKYSAFHEQIWNTFENTIIQLFSEKLKRNVLKTYIKYNVR